MTTNAAAAATDQPDGYREGTWIIDGPVRVCFDHIGEGYGGDYDESDPEDRELLRLDVEVRADSAYAAQMPVEDLFGDDPADAGWVVPDSASICTAVVRDTSGPRLHALLVEAAAEVRVPVEAGVSIRSVMDRLSWITA